MKNTFWINIFILSLLSSCAGFYTKSEQPFNYQQIIDDELRVLLEPTFEKGGRVVDEIEINSNANYDNRIKFLKDEIVKTLQQVNLEKKVSTMSSKENYSGCSLHIRFNEKLLSKSMTASAITFGLWPYIDNREVTFHSKLLLGEKLLSESESKINYKVVFSIFVIPISPFFVVQFSEQKAWTDGFKSSLSKIEFSKCKRS